MSIIDLFETLLTAEVKNNVNTALAEDIGSGDISSEILDKNHTSEAYIITRDEIILCGKMWAETAFKTLDSNISIDWLHNDGDKLKPDNNICKIYGNTRAILTAERVALNFLQTLSATATTTFAYASKIQNYKTEILDTRKTIPGLRLAQKYAVKIGGGSNHRIGLYDAYLLKENHITAAGGIAQAVAKARELMPHKKLEVEVETLTQLKQALKVKTEQILLDNFSLDQIKQAVAITKNNAKLEVSGNVSPANLEDYAKTGVDYISIGALTKNIKAVDLSLLTRGTFKN